MGVLKPLMSARTMVLALAAMVLAQTTAVAQGTVVVRPKEIDDVLVNPGIGFMTFQRFNGDDLNPGTRWTEGYPIEYQPFKGTLQNKNHPMTTIAYFRVYWKFVQPAKDEYRWEILDKALLTAHERGQTLMQRIAPSGTDQDNDVPSWYRAVTGELPTQKLPVAKWRVNPENPAYVEHFGNLIKALGRRYDGHPDLELVDISIVGAWGEGSGSELLTDATRRALLNSYLDSFHKTPLVIQPNDLQKGPRRWGSLPGAAEPYALSKKALGWRVDCLGDMPRSGGPPRANWGPFPGWSHMLDFYPEVIVELGLKDAWIKSPVTMEACGVMQSWKNAGRDVDYIIDQSLKWHISSFNGKSSAVPEEWWPQVNRWLKRMGYRFVLRRFTYPATVQPNQKLSFTSWWENKGVAPCYRQSPLALRLKNKDRTEVLVTDADIRSWLPGDNLYDNAVFIPPDTPKGGYDLDIGLLDLISRKPRVKLAIAGADKEGWYNLGNIKIQ